MEIAPQFWRQSVKLPILHFSDTTYIAGWINARETLTDEKLMPGTFMKVRGGLLKLLYTIALYHLGIAVAIGQPDGREVVDQSVEWFSITSGIELSKKLSLMVEGQARYARAFEPMQYQTRTALEVKLGERFALVPFGYVYTWNYLYGRQPTAFANHEHRLWQQLVYRHSFGKLRLDHRLRTEQRFIQRRTIDDNNVVYEGYSNRQFRARYRFQMRLPLNHPEIVPGTWFLGVYDEAFISWGKPVTFHEPDQNRIFTGVGYQFDTRFSALPGFYYQMLIKDNGLKQENNLGLQVMLTYNIKRND